jgi:hypothetical protein
MTTFGALPGGPGSQALFLEVMGVEHGPTLFYVIGAAMRTEDFAFLVFGPRRVREEGRIRMVAGACNHPNCLVLPFSVELIRLAA